MSETLPHLALLKQTDGISVTITRGEQTCTLTAVPSTSKATLIGSDGSYTQVVVEDWIVIASEFTLTEPAYPKKGDLITVDEASKYLTAHPDDKTPIYANFNPLDRPALAWIIHSIPR